MTANERPADPEWMAKARAWFPATRRCIYMDVANQGLISSATRDSFSAHLEKRMQGVNDELELLGLVERVRERFAVLVNAEPAEVALVKNASEGLGLIASAFLWKAGDNVVVCLDLEHGNNIYPWLNLRERYGIEVRAVAAADGRMPVEAMAAAIDGRTRIATVSTMTTSPGLCTDLVALGRACRERGAFLLCDGAQSAGILHTDVKALPIDGFAASTVKGLMGLYGMGFLYCRKAWAEKLTPPYAARFSVDLGDLPEAAVTGTRYRLREAAKRFDAGHYNFPGALAALASIGQLLEIGTRDIEAHVVGLARRLARGFLEMGVPVAGGPPGAHTGSIVSVGPMVPGFFNTAAEPRINGLFDELTRNGVVLSIRRGLLRFSLHLYNTAAEVDRVLELSRRYFERKPDRARV